MKLYGRIKALDEKQRILTLGTHGRVVKLYLERGMYQRHLVHLQIGHRMLVTVTPRKQKHPPWKLLHIHKIIGQNQRDRLVFSQKSVIEDTKALLNEMRMTMFLDMEMSMHPYHFDKHFMQEIIQVGYLIVDENNHIIKRVNQFIKPHKHPTLSRRTLKFLSLTQQDVDQGVPFKSFYETFEADLKTYTPAIMVWGKNDQIALKMSLELHGITPGITPRFVNLLQLHKNVFLYKDDLGLVKAYELYGHTLRHNQQHDALEDAHMTYHIFEGFKAVLNQTRKNPHPRLQKH